MEIRLQPEQEQHLARMKQTFAAVMDQKYRLGQQEHGGNLWDVPNLLDQALDEVVDLATYLMTLKERELGRAFYRPTDVVPQGKAVMVSDNVLVQYDCPGCPISQPKKTGDVGFDLIVSEDTFIEPWGNAGGEATNVPSRVRIKIPNKYYAQIVGRSSAAHKRGILVHTATIDNGYTGELFACCWNMGRAGKLIKAGERLAQVIFLPAYVPDIQRVDILPSTERGETGFGSTGGVHA